MRSIIALAAIGLGLASAPAMAQAPAPAPDAPAAAATAAAVESPEAFVTAATASNAFEIESSELALEKSEQEAIRTFAQRMIDDHTAAAEDLAAAAEEDGLTAPELELDAAHQAMLDELQQAEGDEFDQLYVTMQTQAHQEAITLHSAFVEEGDAGAVSAFAAEKLPTLEEHLQEVETLETN